MKPNPLHLHCELFWGTERTEVRGFDPETQAVYAASDETAAFPLYGFPLGDAPHLLAEWTDAGLVVFPPPGSTVEPPPAGRPSARPTQHAGRPGFVLEDGVQLRLQSGAVVLQLTASPVGFRAKADPSPAVGWVLTVALMFVVVPVGFLFVSPDAEATKEYADRTLAREREKQQRESAAKRGAGPDDEQLKKMLEPLPPKEDNPDGSTRAVFPTTLTVQ